MASNGNNVLIYTNNHIIGGTRSSEIQTDGDTIEIASATQGAWREFMAGRKNWSITVNYLVAPDTSALSISGGTGLKDLLQVGNTFTLKIYKRGATAVVLQGNAILKTVKITATRGNLIQGTFQFVGNGSLS
jgi:predicted secreted protein